MTTNTTNQTYRLAFNLTFLDTEYHYFENKKQVINWLTKNLKKTSYEGKTYDIKDINSNCLTDWLNDTTDECYGYFKNIPNDLIVNGTLIKGREHLQSHLYFDIKKINNIKIN